MQLPISFRRAHLAHRHLVLFAAAAVASLLLGACHHSVKPVQQALGIFPVVDGPLAQRITHAETVPSGYRILHTPSGYTVVIATTPIIKGRMISGATASIANNSGQPAVSITLTPEGAKKMHAYTTDHIGDRLATVWLQPAPGTPDDYRWTLIQAPTIQGVFGKHFMTSGFNSIDEATQLADALNAQAHAR